MTSFSSNNPFAPPGVSSTEYPPGAPPADEDDVVDVSDMLELNADGVADITRALFAHDSTDAAIDTLVDVIGAELARRANAVDSLDGLLTATLQAKRAKDTFDDAYGVGRTRLWATTGAGDHATESGRTFKFTAPSTSRRTDTKKLERDYPDVYADVVKTVHPKDDAVGTLRLTTPKKGANNE